MEFNKCSHSSVTPTTTQEEQTTIATTQKNHRRTKRKLKRIVKTKNVTLKSTVVIVVAVAVTVMTAFSDNDGGSSRQEWNSDSCVLILIAEKRTVALFSRSVQKSIKCEFWHATHREYGILSDKSHILMCIQFKTAVFFFTLTHAHTYTYTQKTGILFNLIRTQFSFCYKCFLIFQYEIYLISSIKKNSNTFGVTRLIHNWQNRI